MNIKKLTIINGSRDEIEANLARALFGVDAAEITRLSEQLELI